MKISCYYRSVWINRHTFNRTDSLYYGFFQINGKHLPNLIGRQVFFYLHFYHVANVQWQEHIFARCWIILFIRNNLFSIPARADCNSTTRFTHTHPHIYELQIFKHSIGITKMSRFTGLFSNKLSRIFPLWCLSCGANDCFTHNELLPKDIHRYLEDTYIILNLWNCVNFILRGAVLFLIATDHIVVCDRDTSGLNSLQILQPNKTHAHIDFRTCLLSIFLILR